MDNLDIILTRAVANAWRSINESDPLVGTMSALNLARRAGNQQAEMDMLELYCASCKRGLTKNSAATIASGLFYLPEIVSEPFLTAVAEQKEDYIKKAHSLALIASKMLIHESKNNRTELLLEADTALKNLQIILFGLTLKRPGEPRPASSPEVLSPS